MNTRKLLGLILVIILIASMAGAARASDTIMALNTESTITALPVFPGAEGYGTTTPAGSGRHLSPPQTRVYKVTNLDASGSGSLKDCLAASGPRVCVFEVSGTIVLNDDLKIRNPYITIAGQTAPSPGITLRGAGLRVGTHDVLIQHLRIRVGDDPNGPNPENRDGIGIEGSSGVYNVVIDHCSISWAIDGNVDLWYEGVSDVTISHSLISEGLNDSLHPEGTHSTGLLIGKHVHRVSLHASLLAHNRGRNPAVQADTETELINNVFYNWGDWGFTIFSDGGGVGIPLFANVVGNYYQRGVDSPNDPPIQVGGSLAATSKVYVSGNIGPGRESNAADDWEIVSGNDAMYRSLTPIGTLHASTISSAYEAYDSVLKNAGARPADRDAVDERIVEEVRTGTGQIINCVEPGAGRCDKNAGGWPALAQNKRTLIIPANPNGDADGDGYTDLEEWLHAFSADVEGVPRLRLSSIPDDQSIRLTWTLNTTVPVTSTWQIAYDGPAGDQFSPITDIISSTRDYSLTGLTNYRWYTITLQAMFSGTPLLTDTVRMMPTDIFFYLPLISQTY
ncbi:MAG TPA: pectate lyase [Anaerolineae bacterium]|nr:pectate lyase [Anaerolineae bacterium]